MLDLAVRHEVKILVPFRISRFVATLLQIDAEAERSEKWNAKRCYALTCLSLERPSGVRSPPLFSSKVLHNPRVRSRRQGHLNLYFGKLNNK